MNKLIKVNEFYHNSSFLINTIFIIRCKPNHDGTSEITLQFGDRTISYTLKESVEELYDLVNN
jgi:hypothetical protein